MNTAHTPASLELRHLRALHAIRQHGSLTRAAADLHCTQSALSHLIADLERQLGQPLLARTVKPLVFTAAGRRLLATADAVLPLIATTDDDLAGLRRGIAGRLLVSLECHSCFEWLVPSLDTYRAAWPEVDLDLRVGDLTDQRTALRDGVIDVVITSDHSSGPGLAATPLFRYDIVGVLPLRHPLVGRKRLVPRDFIGTTMVTYPVEEARLDAFSRFLVPAGVKPARRRTAELTAMIVQLVASGHGLAVLPRWAVADPAKRGTVVIRPLGTGLWSDLYALRRSEQVETPYLRAFVDTARTVSFRTLEGIKPIR